MIGDIIYLIGIPSLITGILWIFQKLTNTLGPRSTYRRRRVFGALLLFLLSIAIIGMISMLSNPDLASYAARSASKVAIRLIIFGGAIYGACFKEDGPIRSIFVPYAELTPQARERIVTGKTEL